MDGIGEIEDNLKMAEATSAQDLEKIYVYMNTIFDIQEECVEFKSRSLTKISDANRTAI